MRCLIFFLKTDVLLSHDQVSFFNDVTVTSSSRYYVYFLRIFSSQDSYPSLHVKQSSLPSVLLETSFGPDDICDITSHGFSSFTLGRGRKKKKSSYIAPYVAHSRSNSSTVETDTMDAEVASKAHQKILNSSSSSNSIIGNLLSSSLNSSSFNRAPAGSGSNPYSTWTLPRTNRVHQRTLSLRSSKTNTLESIVSAVDASESASDLQRSEFDAVTGINIRILSIFIFISINFFIGMISFHLILLSNYFIFNFHHL